MIDLFETAAALQRTCDGQGWPNCLIGGIAVQRWGQPRVTRDVDLSILTGFGDESRIVVPLLTLYSGRIPDAAAFAETNRVLLLRTSAGIDIDIALAALPFEAQVIARATNFEASPGLTLRTCSAEDLLVLKLFASRPIDVRDAETIVLRQGSKLDWQYVREHLRPLAEAKEDLSIMDTLERLYCLS